MKYAIKFYQGCRVLDKASEIIIKYDKKSVELIDFVQKWTPEQRIVLDIKENEDILQSRAIIAAAKEKHNQIALLMNKNQLTEEVKQMNLDYFFSEGVKTYDELHGQKAAGVSDIYIEGELGFNLPKIYDYCQNNGLRVRVFPNVAQVSTDLPVDPMKSFFIRPEAVKVYEDYVDVFEFYAPLDKQPVLYDIYRDERWLGELQEVIYGLDVEVKNTTLFPHFDLSRAKCNKRCNMGKCDICNVAVDVSKTLADKGLELRKKKAEYNQRAESIGKDSESKVNEEISQPD